MTDWRSVVDDHGPRLFRLVLRILGHVADAEDVVQEVFCEAYRLEQVEQVRNWNGLLRRLAVHRALDRLRRRRATVPLDGLEISCPAESPEDIVVSRELATRLRTMITKLPTQQATVFCLRYFGGRSNAEIAESLGIDPGAVATALHKARTRLKAEFTKIAQGE